jgi:hypothetical protein
MMRKYFPPLVFVSLFLRIILLLKELRVDTLLSRCSSGNSAASVRLHTTTTT